MRRLQGVGAFVDTVVGQMGASLQRLQGLGVSNILVENLVPMSCMPFTALYVNGETACAAADLLDTETSLHDQNLQAKVNELNNGGGNIVMLDFTKALRNVFENGPTYGSPPPPYRSTPFLPNAHSRCSVSCKT
jgi:phospholipase/lecithinase/hemolysin